MLFFGAIVLIQIATNVGYGLYSKADKSRLFKIFAFVFFSALACILPIVLLMQTMDRIQAKSPALPIALAIDEERFVIFWLLQIFVAITIQIIFNQWLINWLQKRGIVSSKN
jgi:hypothetical protein